MEFVYLAYMIMCIAWMVAMFDYKGYSFLVYCVGFTVYALQFVPEGFWSQLWIS